MNEEKTDCEMRRVGREVKVHISYMEIYQDTGYDLLNPGTRPGSLMLTLPKVHIYMIVHVYHVPSNTCTLYVDICSQTTCTCTV